MISSLPCLRITNSIECWKMRLELAGLSGGKQYVSKSISMLHQTTMNKVHSIELHIAFGIVHSLTPRQIVVKT